MFAKKVQRKSIVMISVIALILSLFASPIGSYASKNLKVSKASGTYVVTASTLNVRTGNSTKYKRLGYLKKNEQINVTGTTSNNWYRITFKGKTGYVSGAYLKAAPKKKTPANDGKIIKASGEYTVTASTLNVRSGASIKHKKIGSLRLGSRINVTGTTSNAWYRFNYKGRAGYVSGSYIKKTNSAQIKPTYIKGVLIVNKKYSLPDSYAPGESTAARKAFNVMKNDAKKKGLNLTVFSGYRTYSYQNQLYQHYVARDGKAAADLYSARPGQSEHQTGLSFDIGEVGNENQWFSETPATKWMAKNAHKYGFIVRYPKGKEHITGYKYEPWHLRFLGKDLATKVYKSGLTLEEYLGIN
ncbi:D-alanyl-D-alanine carboxypeptidase family protein [Bacillus norwichensis]|uniref:D-alanyl-D-alanine carboxypeptidase family protein n=1 Tax=Bacillus norwichensis TaxID=2762217 RepID=A0ABR8VPW6_9BACI|nr:D-alanyl-D-alanine carboxypeptidase family protein [Bacillus norwichensis]MBD8006811.1 D-alanyl-D-alanine carboxypeptidase family protein [Bacillus norwichensis]